MKRRDFIGLAASAATAAAAGDGATRADGALPAATAGAKVPPRNRRPYSDVDWSKVVEVHTTSHGHCENQRMLDVYLDRGFEFAPLAKGTFGVCDAVATVKANGGTSIIGGGDSVSAVKKSGKAAEMTHISTGGGASLEYLEGKTLPGVAALNDK